MSEEACTRLEGHKAHMCQLKAQGCIEEMDKHSAKPSFACNKCGAKAESEDFLCQPRPL